MESRIASLSSQLNHIHHSTDHLLHLAWETVALTGLDFFPALTLPPFNVPRCTIPTRSLKNSMEDPSAPSFPPSRGPSLNTLPTFLKVIPLGGFIINCIPSLVGLHIKVPDVGRAYATLPDDPFMYSRDIGFPGFISSRLERFSSDGYNIIYKVHIRFTRRHGHVSTVYA
ncbi:hypothetical protein BD779DRAFT_715701 [Infundibulicybe gibba]|nr:hypothetical protein BD779DRAFT_715701 [Infundibulicybe gibba]